MLRDEVFASLRQQPEISVLIIGGGINGIGLFRELAAQDVDVLLVEKGDFCSGCSAASSHMLHGGLRYLENGEFRLVREALHERNLMLQNAPHYAKPLPTTIPIFSWFSGLLNAPLKFLNWLDHPSERGVVVIKIGLSFYDFFVRKGRVMPKHRFQSRRAALEKRPDLNPKIVATATYYDAWMPTPERICIELLLDAEALCAKARALNYVSARSAAGDSVTLFDELTGESLTVKPKVVVNAAGPWIDLVNDAMQRPTKFIGGTKGSHLVVHQPQLHAATQGHELFFENSDGRIVLFFPLGDKVLMGTTDIPVETPDSVCTPEEEEYILGMVRRVFPKIEVKRSDIVFRFSGVRPLPTSDAATAGQISRDHSIRVLEPNEKVYFPIFSLVGGKWTTFRAFGEQTADQLLPRLGKSRKVSTAHFPIGGGKDYPKEAAAQKRWIAATASETRLPEDRIAILFDRYGTRAAQLAAFIAAGDDQALACKADYSRREVIFIVQQEKVVHLEDFLLRRSLLAMLGQVSRPLLDELAEVIGGALGWSVEQKAAEIQRSLEVLKTRHGVELA